MPDHDPTESELTRLAHPPIPPLRSGEKTTPSPAYQPSDPERRAHLEARRDPDALWSLWFDAAANPSVAEALNDLRNMVDRAVADRQPVCEASGRCCRFESFGHRLFVTGLEAAHVVRSLTSDRVRAATDVAEGACQLQHGGRCSIHETRPLGCRIFFCDPTADAWQQRLYESMQRTIRTIHDTHALPYRYMEWRAALREAALAWRA